MAQIHAHLARDDVRERRLAQARRAEQQHVVERLLALARGLDEDRELAADLFLADVFVELLGPQRALERLFLRRGGRGGNQAVGFDHDSDRMTGSIRIRRMIGVDQDSSSLLALTPRS